MDPPPSLRRDCACARVSPPTRPVLSTHVQRLMFTDGYGCQPSPTHKYAPDIVLGSRTSNRVCWGPLRCGDSLKGWPTLKVSYNFHVQRSHCLFELGFETLHTCSMSPCLTAALLITFPSTYRWCYCVFLDIFRPH